MRRLTRRGFQPAWLPDGRQIVFATQLAPNVEARSNDVSELWVVSAAGGEPRRVFAGDAVQPRVSPHGHRIAFWSLPTDAAQKYFSGANRDVWTIATDGTRPVRVTTHDANVWNPVWSPDGRWLYFLSNRSGSMNLWRIAIDETSGVTSGEPQPLTGPTPYLRHFSLSADGRLGTYATWNVTSNTARARFDPRTGAVQGPLEPLTTGPRDFGALDVSPDGQQLVVQTASRQQEDLYLVATDGSGMRQLTNDQPRDRAPRWSRDGRHVLFYSDRGGNYEVWTIDRDGSSLRALTKSEGLGYPVPSRDGSMVAATRINAWQLFVYGTGDFSKPSEALPLFPEELRQGILAPWDWSPDGRLLAGTTASGAWVYARDTRAYRLVPGTAGAGAVSWLPDGRRITFLRQGRLFVADALSGEAWQLFAIPGEALNSARLNADASYVYFNHGSASGDIWMVRFDDSKR